ncbi:DUF421 domain-containing protein [Geomicrobium sp. JCM 19039]|uniref:DUF421 domain-containing protein n=1 Tax=Geomicrobium sp. JCM 19039 TaxID=1460636 RepID=UPI00045F11F8|nr:DUF421 domain-containing protein [Geomicrobium sp. JCM 19039]GAK11312.1 hypothetical protein JCM19039_998 [Geomicrobium sp. JCM 19039]
MDLFSIFWRVLFFYFFLLISLRVMGKREVGELTLLDFVVSIMIAEFAVTGIEEESLIEGMFPIIILACLQIVLAYISLKSNRLRDLLDGQPTIVIENGKVDEQAMRRLRYNFDDLMLQLRQHDLTDFTQVAYAILEPSGDLSVIEATKNAGQVIFPFPFIVDGEMQMHQLQHIGRDEEWLRTELKKRGYDDVKKIAVCSGNREGNFVINIKADA